MRRVDVQQIAQAIEAQGGGHPLTVQHQRPTESGQCCAQVAELVRKVVVRPLLQIGDAGGGEWQEGAQLGSLAAHCSALCGDGVQLMAEQPAHAADGHQLCARAGARLAGDIGEGADVGGFHGVSSKGCGRSCRAVRRQPGNVDQPARSRRGRS
ncbi:hypothetical protein D3C78_1466690 [compost metagenome]